MTTSQAEAATTQRSPRLSALAARLCPPVPGSTAWGWIGPLLVTAFGAFLRFNRLSVPPSIVFDETYYVPDALGIKKFGYEHNYSSTRNALLARGDPHIFTKGGEFVAHPPFGKVMIAGGEWLFGLTPFGWRFAACLVGSLAILMTARITRRMTRSTLLGCVAGLLLSLEGLEFVMSRTALLDIFLMFWVLAAFGCLVVDRDQARARLAERMQRRPRDDAGPGLGVRWWRVLAGVCLGLACASKWNGIWYVPAFAALTIAWDVGARRAAGLSRPVYGGLVRDGRWMLASLGAVAVVAYLAAWSGWLFSSGGYDRNWAAQHGIHTPVISALVSLFEYNKAMLHFDSTLTTHHPYESQPWTWMVLGRPVSYYYVAPKLGQSGCHVAHCSQEVLAIGTPMIWWVSIATLVICLAWWLTQRDWRAGAVLVGVAAGWLPWFLFLSRTKFYFYAVAFAPFLVISITLCLGLLIGPVRASAARRATGAAITGAYLLAVLLNFWYLYPVLAAQVVPYSSWLARMWFSSWI
jgi:dolichyl-phosphate-mannose--protein O-mannosyl transferase